jgi:protein-L-isoaspartate(D-aspartate) O-methyltransferase
MVKLNQGITFKEQNLFREKRQLLVKSLRNKGITDDELLAVMEELPRELFVDPPFINRAYDDTALPIKCMQTISQPYTVAYMTELLCVKPSHKVLEIGTGSGYQAAILYLLGAKVYTIERIPELLNNANDIFEQMGFKINCFLGDGSIGLSKYAPFDSIIVTAAAPSIPNRLIEQLKIGGRLVIPIGSKSYQTMNLIIKHTDNNYQLIEKDTFKFVPLIGDNGWNAEN